MTEFIRTPRDLVERVRGCENMFEDEIRDKKLADHLFHNAHLAASLEVSPDNQASLSELERRFVEAKKKLNFGERFELALQPEFLGKIHIVDLGTTTSPGEEGQVDGLKKEYLDHLEWMKEKELVDGELSRTESKRTITMRLPALPEAKNQVVIFERNRPLIDVEIVHDGIAVRVFIGKRMVFGLPFAAAVALQERQGGGMKIVDEDIKAFIEEVYLEKGQGGVIPIRTSYIMATDIIE